jgi:1,2-dihydroxy-3-keto-5-methylthiopentene dioxygenase
MTIFRTSVPDVADDRGDQRAEHDSGNAYSAADLDKLGIVYRSIPIDAEGKWQGEIDMFAKERGYKNVGHSLTMLM